MLDPYSMFISVSFAVSAGTAVYGALSRESLKAAKQDRDEWKEKEGKSREEVHARNNDLQGAVVREAELRGEIELLKEKTDFSQVKNTLEGFIQRQDHEAERQRDASIKRDEVLSSLSDNLKILTIIMGRMVPELVKEQIAEQEKELHEA